jgi:hypothetical protein
MIKGIPCHVVKVDKDIVTVHFDIQNNVWSVPEMKMPVAFSDYVRDPTQVGDKGYASPADFYLGGNSGLGGGVADFSPRGNLTTLVFHPMSKTTNEPRDYDQLTLTGGPHGVKIIQKKQQQNTPLPPPRPRPDNPGSTPAPSTPAAPSTPVTTFNMDQNGAVVVNALSGIAHVADNVLGLPGMPSSLRGIVHIAGGGIMHIADNMLGGKFPTSMSGIVHMAGSGIMHIADNVLGGVLPAPVAGITHLALGAINYTSMTGNATLASVAGALNLVSQGTLNIGGPAAGFTPSTTSAPVPSVPTVVNLLGSLAATVNITAAGIVAGGTMTAGGAAVLTHPQQLNNAPKTVTGSKGGNVALANLLTALVSLGLIVDNTT